MEGEYNFIAKTGKSTIDLVFTYSVGCDYRPSLRALIHKYAKNKSMDKFNWLSRVKQLYSSIGEIKLGNPSTTNFELKKAPITSNYSELYRRTSLLGMGEP